MWFPEWPASHSVRWGRWATSWVTDRFPLLGRFKTWRGGTLIFRASTYPRSRNLSQQDCLSGTALPCCSEAGRDVPRGGERVGNP